MKSVLFIVIAFILLCSQGCGQKKQVRFERVRGDSLKAFRLLNDTNKPMLIPRSDTVLSRITVYGKNWYNNTNGNHPVQVWLNGELIIDPDILYKDDSSFLLRLPELYGIRNYTLTALQPFDSVTKKRAEIHIPSQMQHGERE